jgi:hypothetical protein
MIKNGKTIKDLFKKVVSKGAKRKRGDQEWK